MLLLLLDDGILEPRDRHYCCLVANSLKDGRALQEHMEDYYLQTLQALVVATAVQSGDKKGAKLAAGVVAASAAAAAAGANAAAAADGKKG